MSKMKPDVIARIRMYTKEEGGKHKTITGEHFGCPFYYQHQGFDCRLLLENQLKIHAGDTVEVPITFLFAEDIKSRLKQGDTFTLWDQMTFAEGEILRVL